MAVDKLVDSTQLNADLTTVANAIRTKGGTSAQLAFPAGFVSAVEAIETGWGGEDLLGKRITNTLTSYSNDDVTSILTYGFYNCSALTSVAFPNVTSIASRAFQGCTQLSQVSFPALLTGGSLMFDGTSITVLVLPEFGSVNQGSNHGPCNGMRMLQVADFGTKCFFFGANAFQNAQALTTVIIRTPTAGLSGPPVIAVNSFSGTPFESGGSGGDIYIDDSFYQELGTGSAYDYKAATNWSVIDGYGTITWKNIKGSIYETQYADGTPIT